MSGLLLAQVVDRAAKGEVARPRPGQPDHESINGLADLRIVALVLLATALMAALATRWRGSAFLFGAIFAGAFLLYGIVAPAASADPRSADSATPRYALGIARYWSRTYDWKRSCFAVSGFGIDGAPRVGSVEECAFDALCSRGRV